MPAGGGVDGGGDGGELDLHNAGLTVLDDASVPGTPEQRAAIRKLDVSFNQLSAWTQAGLALLQQLTGLRELHAYDNAIDSLAFVNACPSLAVAVLSGNRVASFAGVKSHRALRILKLDGNRLASLDTLSAVALPQLTHLDVSGNALCELTGLALLPELVELDAARNRITRVTGLERCASLAELNLAGNRVSVLAGVPASLQTLRLDRNGLRAFRNWDTLRVVELSLAGNALSAVPPEVVQVFPALEELDLSDNALETAESLRPLAQIASLCELRVTGNPLCSSVTRPGTASASGAVATSYRDLVLKVLPDLDVLDDIAVTNEATEQLQAAREAVGAANDASQRETCRRISADGIALQQSFRKLLERMQSVTSQFRNELGLEPRAPFSPPPVSADGDVGAASSSVASTVAGTASSAAVRPPSATATAHAHGGARSARSARAAGPRELSGGLVGAFAAPSDESMVARLARATGRTVVTVRAGSLSRRGSLRDAVQSSVDAPAVRLGAVDASSFSLAGAGAGAPQPRAAVRRAASMGATVRSAQAAPPAVEPSSAAQPRVGRVAADTKPRGGVGVPVERPASTGVGTVAGSAASRTRRVASSSSSVRAEQSPRAVAARQPVQPAAASVRGATWQASSGATASASSVLAPSNASAGVAMTRAPLPDIASRGSGLLDTPPVAESVYGADGGARGRFGPESRTSGVAVAGIPAPVAAAVVAPPPPPAAAAAGSTSTPSRRAELYDATNRGPALRKFRVPAAARAADVAPSDDATHA